MIRRRRRVALVLVPLSVVSLSGCGGDDLQLSEAAAEGRSIADDNGCAACHGTRGQGGVGPAWQGLYGAPVRLADGTTVTADDAYLARAMTDPAADIVEGYTIRMPPNTLTEAEVDAVIAYISELP